MEYLQAEISMKNQHMKKRIFLAAAAFLYVCNGMSQVKKAIPPAPPPPPPTAVESVEAPPPPPVQAPAPVPDDYKDFLSRNPSVKSIAWLKDNKVRVQLKSGTEEVYDLGNKQDTEKFTARYGALPEAPPPPPPAPAKPPKAPKAPQAPIKLN